MAEEVVFSAEGAASINEADASPKPAFEDLEQKLLALGIPDEDLESVGQEFWKQVHEGDQSAQYAWKKAFFGVLIQWMYRLSLEAGLKEQLNEVMAETVAKLQTEAGRDVQDIAREALDTYYAY